MDNVSFENFGRSDITVRTFDYVFDKLDNGYIVLNPPFQRKYVWDEELERKLISTVYCGGDIGRVVFNRAVDEEGNIEFLCIDGKQRLTALQKFRKNKFDAEIDGKDIFFRDMTREQRDLFLQQKIAVRTYDAMSEENQTSLFKLIQNGKPLTSGELLKGTNCSFAKLIGRLRRHVPSGIFAPYTEKRMEETTPLLRLVVLCLRVNEKQMNMKDVFFCNEKKCNDWAIGATIKEKQEERVVSSMKHLSRFLKDSDEVLEKKTATFIYLTHLIYLKEKEISDEGRHQRYKIIKKLKKSVDEILSNVRNSSYYIQSTLDSHVRNAKRVMREVNH